MRLVIWNCNMALHSKLPLLLALDPDIAVVPESANNQTLRQKSPLFAPMLSPWVGDNPNKGLGVFAFGDYRIELEPELVVNVNRDRWFAPVRVSGPVKFNLFAAWICHHPIDLRKANAGPIMRTIERSRAVLSSAPSVMAGDFNHNVYWDKPGRAGNFANVVSAFEQIGLSSVYHRNRVEAHGAELEPTIYWRDRRSDGPKFHIDYCFASESMHRCVSGVEVGTFESWVANKASDHVPLIVDFNDADLDRQLPDQPKGL